MVCLDLLKKQVRADDFTADDKLLQMYLDTATATVIAATNRTYEELQGMTSNGELPLQVQQAILMLAADWYNQREDTTNLSANAVPNGVRMLVAQFRKLGEG